MKPIKIGKVREFQDGEIKLFKFFAKPIAVWRKGEDFIAYENACLHMRAQLLSAGFCNSEKLTCPWHGWQYNLVTGSCLTKEGLYLKRFAVSVENDEVIVDLSNLIQ